MSESHAREGAGLVGEGAWLCVMTSPGAWQRGGGRPWRWWELGRWGGCARAWPLLVPQRRL